MVGRTSSRALAVVVGLALTSACEGELLHVGDDVRRSATSEGEESPPLKVDSALLARCPDPSETTRRLSDEPDVASSELEGRWVRCRGNGRGVVFNSGLELRGPGGAWFGLEESPLGLVRSRLADRRGSFWTDGSSIRFTFESKLEEDTVVVLVDASGTKMTAVYSDYEGPLEVTYVHE